MLRRLLTGTALAFCVLTPAAGADLLEIYRQALGSDPVYSAARAGYAAAQEKQPQGLAGLLPQATLSASTQHNDRDLNFRDPTATDNRSRFNSRSASVSVTQPIYRAQNLAAYDQGKTQVAIATAQFAAAGQDLILRAAQAYFDVLLSRDNLAFSQAQKIAIGQQLEQARRNFEVGNATITDTHEAQARFDLVTAQEIAARNELEIRNRALEQLIGRNAPALAVLGKNFSLRVPAPASMDQWVERARSTNLAVRAAQENMTLSNLEIRRNRGAHLPTLDAVASYTDSASGSGTQGGSGTETNTRIVGLQLSLPLYQGGLVNSRVREAVANEEKARQELENARRSAELAARQGYLGVTSGIAQVRALEAALTSSETSLTSTRLGQEVGVRTQVDVLNAQQQVFSARRDLAQARYNYILSLLRLSASAGELDEADLQQVNAWLEKR